MYTRTLQLPSRSFLLLGPRGVGKTTWLRDKGQCDGPVGVYPLHSFLEDLSSGQILPASK